jgi:hypothetical protein
VFPASTHPSGERVEWHCSDLEILRIERELLRAHVAKLAAAALRKRHPDDPTVEGHADCWLRTADPQRSAPKLVVVKSARGAERFEEAKRHYNAECSREWGRAGAGKCPACPQGHGEHSFGQQVNDTNRWACFSASHPDQCGIRSRSGDCHHGDAVDLDAFLAGMAPAEFLRKTGFLEERRER